MGKADKNRATQQLQEQTARNNMLFGSMFNNYNQGINRGFADYDSIMGGYRNFLGMPSGGGYQSYQPYQAPAQQFPTFNGGGIMGRMGNKLVDKLKAQMPSSSGGGPVDTGGWDEGRFTQQFGRPNTVAELEALEPKLNAAGIKLARNAQGVAGKIVLPNGQYVDVMNSAGLGGKGFQWLTDDGGSGGGGGMNSPMGGWEEFARTGGFSPQDIQNMRARATGVARSVYSNAQDELARAKNLSGGYMPNFAAANSQMARQLSNNLANITQSTDADIAQMIHSGRLAGLQGMTGAQLGALGGMQGLYGTSPGLASMFGNQVLNASGQGLQGAGLYQGLGQMQGFPWQSILKGGLGAASIFL